MSSLRTTRARPRTSAGMLVVGRARQVIGHLQRGLQEVEEEDAHRREDAALVRDLAVQHVVERRDPIGRDEEQVVVVDAIELAHLAAGQMAVVGQSGRHRARLSAGIQR
jgi:hypothetical protein